MLRIKAKALPDHQVASRARSKRSRVAGAATPDAAAADISSIASAKAIWTAWVAAPARILEERARQRSPLRRVGGLAARPPGPRTRVATSTSPAARADRL